MQTAEQYFPVTLSLSMLCKVILPFESLYKIVCRDLLMKAFEQYFAVVLFIMF